MKIFTESKLSDRAMPDIFSSFLEKAAQTDWILSTHISLFAAICFFNQGGGPTVPFAVSRRKLMYLSRIRSFSTYHKCMRELVEYGYIQYEPSWHPKKGSRITLVKPSNDQGSDKKHSCHLYL